MKPTCEFCRHWIALLLLASACSVAAQTPPVPDDPSRQGSVRLGIAIEAVPFDELERMGLEHGVVVREAVDSGPAGAAGVRPGDIVVALDGRAAYSPQRLQWLVGRVQSPDRIELELLRDGETQQVTVDATHGMSREPGAPAADRRAPAQRAYLGIRMQALTADQRAAAGVGDGRGILVADVVEDGPAAAAGVQAGDVLVALADRAVRDPADVQRAMAYFDPGERVGLELIRDGQQHPVEVELGGVGPSRFHGRLPPQSPFRDWRDWSQPWTEPWRRAPLPPALPDRFGEPAPRYWPPGW